MVITVPAFGFLWSRHDERHHHRRRYTRRELLALVRAAGLRPVRASYFNSLLFLPIAGARILHNLLGLEGGADEALPPRALNRLLGAIFASERHLLGRVPLPAGVSLLVIARRSAA